VKFRLKIGFLALLLFSFTNVSDAGICDYFFGLNRKEVSTSLHPEVDKMLEPGKYEVLKKIGEGGLSDVYRVREIANDNIFVLKVLRPADFKDRKAAKIRNKNELKILQLLSSDTDAPVPKSFLVSRKGAKDKKTVLFAMEELNGFDLSDFLEKLNKSNTKMSPQDVSRILVLMSKALKAVHYLHQKHNLLHNDLKGENLWVTGSGEVKVIDFGLSDFSNKKPFYIEQGYLTGTPGFVPPEGWYGNVYDKRSDIFSMGTLLEAIFSRLKIPQKEWGRSPADIGNVDMTGNNYELTDGLTRKLQKIYKKATQLEAKDRYQTAEDMAQDVEDLAKEIHRVLVPNSSMLFFNFYDYQFSRLCS
jgi:serine/threonine-protein kinase